MDLKRPKRICRFRSHRLTVMETSDFYSSGSYWTPETTPDGRRIWRIKFCAAGHYYGRCDRCRAIVTVNKGLLGRRSQSAVLVHLEYDRERLLEAGLTYADNTESAFKAYWAKV